MSQTTAMEKKPLWQRLIGMRWLVIVCVLAAAASFVNGLAFLAFSVSIGGDAMGTVPSGGHFFVTDHGHETPVAEKTWLISLFHTTATMLLFPLGFLSVAFLILRVIWIRTVELEEARGKSQRTRDVMEGFIGAFGAFGLLIVILATAGSLWGVFRSWWAYRSL